MQPQEVSQKIHSYSELITHIEKRYNINTSDFKGRFDHKINWYKNKNYAFNEAGMAINPAHFTEYVNAKDGDLGVPETCNFKTFLIESVLNTQDYHLKPIEINSKSILEKTIEIENKKYGKEDWASYICRLLIQKYGTKNMMISF